MPGVAMKKLEFENAFEAVSDDPAVIADLTLRSDLLNIIIDIIETNSWSPNDVAAKLNLPQPRVSELLRGKLQLLSVKTLVGYLAQLGFTVRTKLADKQVINIEIQTVAA